MTNIDSLREKIDHIDQELVALLNQRHAYALEIGEIKFAEGLPLSHFGREQQVMDGLVVCNSGPLLDHALRSVFELIIENSKDLVAQHMASLTDKTDNENK